MSEEMEDFAMAITDGDKLWFKEAMGEAINDLPCVSRGILLAKIEQRLDNGDTYDNKLTKHKEISISRGRLYTSIVRIIVGIPCVCYTMLKILKLI